MQGPMFKKTTAGGGEGIGPRRKNKGGGGKELCADDRSRQQAFDRGEKGLAERGPKRPGIGGF